MRTGYKKSQGIIKRNVLQGIPLPAENILTDIVATEY